MLLLVSANAFGQNRADLEKQKAKKLQEIAFTQKLIDATTAVQRKNLNYLIIVRRQIENREQLLKTIELELQLLANSIDNTNAMVNALQADLNALLSEYEKMIFFAYKNQTSYDYLIYIFASQSMNQAFKRLKFIGYYTEVRKNQIELIKSTKESLQSKIEALQLQIGEKEVLMKNLAAEREKLKLDLEEKDEIMQELKGKEKDYLKKLAEDKKIAKELDLAIEDLIASEVVKVSIAKDQLTQLFEKRKTEFNWPVKGFVASEFGQHEHPTIKSVQVSNNGIDIRTEANELVKAIYAGEVMHVVFIPGANYAVIIQHGSYFTVYKNLIELAVQAGDAVEEGQPIGKVYFDETKGAAELHFEVRKSNEKLNPILWLKKS